MASPRENQRQHDSFERHLLGTIGAVIGLSLSILWLLNLTAGFIEIPDNLPIVGNIDEAFATWTAIVCLRYLGIDILPFFQKPAERESRSSQDVN